MITAIYANNLFDQHGNSVRLLKMESVEAQVRRMLASALSMQESSLTDDFRCIDAMGIEDSGYFLARLNDAFADVPQGFSFGTGRLPFRKVDAELQEQIATVGGLTEHVRQQTDSLR